MILRQKTQTRRTKATNCSGCGHTIRPGAKYSSTIGFDDFGGDHPTTAHTCLKCAEAILDHIVANDQHVDAQTARQAVEMIITEVRV